LPAAPVGWIPGGVLPVGEDASMTLLGLWLPRSPTLAWTVPPPCAAQGIRAPRVETIEVSIPASITPRATGTCRENSAASRSSIYLSRRVSRCGHHRQHDRPPPVPGTRQQPCAAVRNWRRPRRPPMGRRPRHHAQAKMAGLDAASRNDRASTIPIALFGRPSRRSARAARTF